MQFRGNALCGCAHRIITMAAHAHRAQTSVVAALMTVRTGQDSMHPAQRTADRIVTKARRQEALLGMTVSAARTQRVVMDVISLVTGNAGISQPRKFLPVFVTVQTRKAAMRARNRYRGASMPIWQPLGIEKVAHGWQMASPTVLALVPTVTVLFVVAPMASITAVIRHLEGQRLTFGWMLDCGLVTAPTATACGCLFVSSYQYEASVSIVSKPFSGLCSSIAKQLPAC